MKKAISLSLALTVLVSGLAYAAPSTKIFTKQRGAEMVVQSGGTVTVQSGGSIAAAAGTLTYASTAVTATGAELNLVDGAPATFTVAAAAGASNVSNVTITVKDAAGATLAGIRNLEIWLSDAATGAGITGTAASGTVQVKSNEGTDLTALTAKKHLIGQTKVGGTYILEITDTSKTGYYVCVKNPITGAPACSAQLVAGSYGS